MSDWRDLPAGRELDRVIAERLGWWYVADPGPSEGWYGPDYDANTSPYPKSFPDFSADANAALSLPLPPRTWFVIYGPSAERDTWDVELQDIGPVFEQGQAEAPALAICRAWLAWHDKQS